MLNISTFTNGEIYETCLKSAKGSMDLKCIAVQHGEMSNLLEKSKWFECASVMQMRLTDDWHRGKWCQHNNGQVEFLPGWLFLRCKHLKPEETSTPTKQYTEVVVSKVLSFIQLGYLVTLLGMQMEKVWRYFPNVERNREGEKERPWKKWNKATSWDSFLVWIKEDSTGSEYIQRLTSSNGSSDQHAGCKFL